MLKKTASCIVSTPKKEKVKKINKKIRLFIEELRKINKLLKTLQKQKENKKKRKRKR